MVLPQWQPLKNSRQGSELPPMAMGVSKSLRVTKDVSKLRHNGRRGPLTKHSTFVQNMIWEVCLLGAGAQGLQGQAGPQVHQEKGGGREQDGGGGGGRAEHRSPRTRQEYTFRHTRAHRTPAESGQEDLTSGKEGIDPRKTGQDQGTRGKNRSVRGTGPALAGGELKPGSDPHIGATV